MRTDFDAGRFGCLATASGIMLGLLLQRADPALGGWDKPAHFFAFALISALLMHGTAGQAPLAILAAVIGFGAMDEMQHLLVPGRTADLADFIADAVAAAVVIGLLCARKKTTSRKEKPCVELSRPLPAATSSRS